jgi:hypothetical protein
MFVGHAAVALAGKARAPRVSLGVLFAAAFGLDLLWPLLVLLGVERVRIDPGNTAFTPLAFDAYPWSHSLLLVLLWSALAGAVVMWRRGRAAGVLVALLVVSHWALDVSSHRPDMPLWPGVSPLVGLGLWNSIAATLLVEGALFAAGIAIYLRTTRAQDRVGAVAFWSLMGLCAVIWISGPFSPPPPGARAVALAGLALWLLVLWAAWADRHRRPRRAS